MYYVSMSRTAALLALAACSVKLSGAAAPAASSLWYAPDGVRAAVVEWGAFLSEGLALGLLGRHFAGFRSALACM